MNRLCCIYLTLSDKDKDLLEQTDVVTKTRRYTNTPFRRRSNFLWQLRLKKQNVEVFKLEVICPKESSLVYLFYGGNRSLKIARIIIVD